VAVGVTFCSSFCFFCFFCAARVFVFFMTIFFFTAMFTLSVSGF
jgi:hypothetical protein